MQRGSTAFTLTCLYRVLSFRAHGVGLQYRFTRIVCAHRAYQGVGREMHVFRMPLRLVRIDPTAQLPFLLPASLHILNVDFDPFLAAKVLPGGSVRHVS